ncbi:MAG: ATP synthase F1 subunit epsilon [Sulfurospirillaceae bacterium]|jgi:F-type H+-transporting ATPase subunit epsilon|nr:ATP synthase F1 subunit epsilon [Sulfurospirillaceae bacterium]MCK9545308.1 ATP synthase F1 subunit epsilon [Sulfurospirillaceae bacterium]MDY0237327.1 ATP synthase F1 subunit epsilon [Campylobacterales bacterium]NLM98568.1 F0F1 ATP synthase subunit epsilon [Campylobacteraceae bacterium]
MDLMKLEIVTPLGLIFSKEIKEVTLPGREGEFGVLPGHTSLVSILKAGVVDIILEDGRHEAVAINWGHVNVGESKVTILADGAVSVYGSSESEIAASIEKAKDLIKSMTDSEIVMAAAMTKIENIARPR